MRARQLLKHKSDVVLSVAHIKAMMRAHAGRNPITFGCLQSTDDATYVNRALANPILVLGVAAGSADAARYGTLDDAYNCCLLYTSPSPRDQRGSRMPSSA